MLRSTYLFCYSDNLCIIQCLVTRHVLLFIILYSYANENVFVVVLLLTYLCSLDYDYMLGITHNMMDES